MAELRVRPMTSEEFQTFRAHAIAGYAAEHVRAGNWSAEDAERLACEDTQALLPQGQDTPGMLFLTAETEHAMIGIAWVALERPGTQGAWVYDIEIVPEHRGKGHGRALLDAVEQAVAQHGGETIGLNVFASNAVARGLYESCGYEATSLHMRKRLRNRPHIDLDDGDRATQCPD